MAWLFILKPFELCAESCSCKIYKTHLINSECGLAYKISFRTASRAPLKENASKCLNSNLEIWDSVLDKGYRTWGQVDLKKIPTCCQKIKFQLSANFSLFYSVVVFFSQIPDLEFRKFINCVLHYLLPLHILFMILRVQWGQSVELRSSAVIKMACALLKALKPCSPLCQVMFTSTKDVEMTVSLRNVG